MTNRDGGPAFPVHGGHTPDDDPRNRIMGGGMTLRDWFAGQALEWYTDARNYETNYTTRPCGCCADSFVPINGDKGEKARAALALIDGEKHHD